CPGGGDDRVPVPGWDRIGVRLEDAFLAGGAGPVTAAADLMRIGLPHHVRPQVGRSPGMGWRLPTGEPGVRQVDGAPEVVDGAGLADEAGPKLLEDALD